MTAGIKANVDGSAAIQVGGTDVIGLGSTGNINFPVSGQRITGDFSNATLANRVMFQTSTTNGNTTIGILPNGTAVQTNLHLYNGTDTANTTIFALNCTSIDTRINSAISGTGTYLPMTFYTNGSEKLRIAADATGTYTFGGTAPRITGDFSNATVANRAAFQTSTTNANTVIPFFPNGTGNNAGVLFYNATDTANSSRLDIRVTSSEASLTSAASGTGTALPMTFYTGGSERARIDTSGNFQFNSGYGSVATAYGCRAWVNFDGTSNTANLSGTYSQSGTTVTVTATAHGLIAGNVVYSDITTGTAVDGTYTVATVISSSQFTYTAGTSLTTSGNVTLRRNTIRASGNVSSVADNGTGDYTVNFSVAMPDANYSVTLASQLDQGGGAGTATMGSGIYRTAAALSSGSFRLYTAYSTSVGQAQADMTTNCVNVFR